MVRALDPQGSDDAGGSLPAVTQEDFEKALQDLSRSGDAERRSIGF